MNFSSLDLPLLSASTADINPSTHFYVVLGLEPRAWCAPSKHLPTSFLALIARVISLLSIGPRPFCTPGSG